MKRSDLRNEWRDAKSAARALNNGDPVDAVIDGRSLDLGPSLDAWTSAKERYEDLDRGPERDQARLDFIKIDRTVRGILSAYESYLRSNPVAMREISQSARTSLASEITIISNTTTNERVRLGIRDPGGPGGDPGGLLPPFDPEGPGGDPDDPEGPGGDPDDPEGPGGDTGEPEGPGGDPGEPGGPGERGR